MANASCKNTRYIIALIPALSIIFACGISNIKNYSFKKYLYLILTLVLTCQFFYLSFDKKITFLKFNSLEKFLFSKHKNIPSKATGDPYAQYYKFFDHIFSDKKNLEEHAAIMAEYYNLSAYVNCPNNFRRNFASYLTTKHPEILIEFTKKQLVSKYVLTNLFANPTFYNITEDQKNG